ncbi:hypothetical protein BH11MYX4_BH11MYX4_10150 [soil metagenome]
MKRILRTVAFSFGFSALVWAAAPGKASAQEANGLGEKGELIVTADRLMPLFSYSSQTVTTNQNNQETKTTDSGSSIALLFGRDPSLAINPHTVPRLAIDYTVIHHLTVGGSVVLAIGLGGSRTTEIGNSTQKNDADKATVFGLAPRVGYVLPLGQTFGFWPRAGFAFYSISSKSQNTANNGNVTTNTDTDTVWSLDLDPQFVWVPLQHFFAHFGPLLNIPLTGSRSSERPQNGGTQTTSNDLSVFHFGLSAGLGGWFDL